MKRLRKTISKPQLEAVPHHPVLLVPGLASSSLRVLQSPYPSWVNRRVWLSVRSIGLGKILANSEAKELGVVTRKWIQHMVLAEDGVSDPPGIKVRAVGGLEGVKYLDPGVVSSELSYVFGPLVSHLQQLGYSRHNLAAASYDWRLPPSRQEERDSLFSRMQAMVENMHLTCGQKVVFVAHSLGTRVTQFFLEWVADESRGGANWAEMHVQCFVAAGPVWLGSPKAFRSVLSGELDELSAFLYAHEGLALTRTAGVMPWMFPAEKEGSDGVVQVLTADGSAYESRSMHQVLLDSDLEGVAAIYRKHYLENPQFDARLVPRVPRLLSVYGVNVRTEVQYYYRHVGDEKAAGGDSEELLGSLAARSGSVSMDLDRYAKANVREGQELKDGIVYETPDTPQELAGGEKRCGDGTVPYASMAYCKEWQREGEIEVTVKELEGVDHRGILKDPAFFKTVTDVCCSSPLPTSASLSPQASSAAIAAELRIQLELERQEEAERMLRMSQSMGAALSPLESVEVKEFDRIWDDRGTGCVPYRVSIHRPVPLKGFFILGDYAERSHASSPAAASRQAVIAVRERVVSSPRLLLPALDFERVWSNSKKHKRGLVAIWRPIAPPGYVALGVIATSSYAKPSPLDIPFRCVHLSVVVEGGVAQLYSEYLGCKATRRMLWRAREGLGGFRASLWLVRPHNFASSDNEKLVHGHTMMPKSLKGSASQVIVAPEEEMEQKEEEEEEKNEKEEEREDKEEKENLEKAKELVEVQEDGSITLTVPEVLQSAPLPSSSSAPSSASGQGERPVAVQQKGRGGERKRKRDILKRHRMRRLRRKIERMDKEAGGKLPASLSKRLAVTGDREKEVKKKEKGRGREEKSLAVPDREEELSSDDDWSTDDEESERSLDESGGYGGEEEDELDGWGGWEMIEAKGLEDVTQFDILTASDEQGDGSGFGAGLFSGCFTACPGFHPPAYPQFCLSASAVVPLCEEEERELRETYVEGYLHVQEETKIAKVPTWKRFCFFLEPGVSQFLLAFTERAAGQPARSYATTEFTGCKVESRCRLGLLDVGCGPQCAHHFAVQADSRFPLGSFPFSVSTVTGELLLVAGSEEERRRWMEAVRKVQL